MESDLQRLLTAFQTGMSAWQARPDASQLAALEALQRQMQQALRQQQISSLKQSYLTEFHRQLRLLGSDLAFLKAARQSATQTQRLAQIGDRLQALQRYYDAMSTGE